MCVFTEVWLAASTILSIFIIIVTVVKHRSIFDSLSFAVLKPIYASSSRSHRANFNERRKKKKNMAFETFSLVPLSYNVTARNSLHGCRKISRPLALSSGYKRSIVIYYQTVIALLNASLENNIEFPVPRREFVARVSKDKFSLQTTCLPDCSF